jgi:hypothetical protein
MPGIDHNHFARQGQCPVCPRSRYRQVLRKQKHNKYHRHYACCDSQQTLVIHPDHNTSSDPAHQKTTPIPTICKKRAEPVDPVSVNLPSDTVSLGAALSTIIWDEAVIYVYIDNCV